MYQKPENFKFCAPFKITKQKREGLSSFENPVFFCTSKNEWIKQEIKIVHIWYSDWAVGIKGIPF